MNYLRRYKKQLSLAMLIIAGLMAVDVIYQIQMHVRWRLWLGEVLAAKQTQTQPATQVAPNAVGDIHASLKRRNIFIEPPPTGHGITLAGVMGKMAIFNNRGGQTFTVEEGKSANGVTVKSITGYEVSVECNGGCEMMKLFQQAAGPPVPPPGSAPPGPPPVQGPRPSMEIKSNQETTTQQVKEIQGSLNRDTQPCTTAP